MLASIQAAAAHPVLRLHCGPRLESSKPATTIATLSCSLWRANRTDGVTLRNIRHRRSVKDYKGHSDRRIAADSCSKGGWATFCATTNEAASPFVLFEG